MSFPTTVTITGTTTSPWKVINAPMWGPTEVSFNVTISGTVSWSIVLTNTNLLADMWNINAAGPSGPTPITAKTYAGPTVLTTQTGNAAGVVNDPFFAWQVTNTGTGTVTVEAIEAGMH